MNNLQKLRIPDVLKWVSLFCTENTIRPSKSNLYASGSNYILHPSRFCSTERATSLKDCTNLGELSKRSRLVKREAQAALLEYLHSTRSLQFIDAENMSKNAPDFFDKLTRKVEIDESGVERSLTRFLRYHPINEFEPFFESIGLKRLEYSKLLPRELMFLNDDGLMMENYYVLCNYGVTRNRIGRIYKEATEIFRWDYGVLQSKLRSFQDLGLKQSLVVKIIASSPYLLKGNMDEKFLTVIENLKGLGIDCDWLEGNICELESYDYKRMVEILNLFRELGISEEKLGEIITQHPDFLLEQSGLVTFCLFGWLVKLGATKIDLQTVFLEFPQMPVLKFTNNVIQCFNFFVEIDMSIKDISLIVHSHPLLLGSCKVKKVQSLLGTLNCGKNRLYQLIKEDPTVLKKWVFGKKVDRLPEANRVLKVRTIKTEFLLNLGFVEKSKEMEKALKVFRGKGDELQERFDCLVNMGLSRDEVIAMVKVSPQILNQSKNIIEMKIGFFVNDLGYPVSDVVTHPALISYTIQRVKLRLLTYEWLKSEGVVHSKLALSTIMSSSEIIFLRTYVNNHPRGREFWERLKKEIYSE